MTPHIPQFVLDMAEKQRKEYFRLQDKIEEIKKVAIENAKEREKDKVSGYGITEMYEECDCDDDFINRGQNERS